MFTLVLPITWTVLLVALLIDRIVGDPDWLWRRLPHPVAWFGAVIGWADRRFNRDDLSAYKRKRNGVIFIDFAILISALVGWVLSRVFGELGTLGVALEIAVVTIFLAHKSLLDHVCAVADGLRNGGLDGGRGAVAMIVGRDPKTLDEPGVSRAAIESLAENFSDGVVAPAFWYLLFGLPGLLAYKMINTADSMIGHMTAKHRDFGWMSAVIDDAVNWVPARLAAVLIMLTQPTALRSNVAIVWRDASLHRSPNAGWPESAMAAVSGLALGGPRIYRGYIADEPFMNDAGRKDASETDIRLCVLFADRAFWSAFALLLLAIIVSA
ncbi:MAG: adenosylcobinamide-phosphate synthase CbiB [Pseudomonadota bacterium]